MRSFKINDSGDLVFDSAELVMVDGVDDIKQSARIIIQTRVGEFFFDENMGLERDNLLGKNLDFEFLKQDITHAILEQEGRIESVVQIGLEQNGRELKVSVKMTVRNNPELIESEVVMNA